MARRPTGIDALDRRLGGGIPNGAMVVVETPPASNAGLLLERMVPAGTVPISVLPRASPAGAIHRRPRGASVGVNITAATLEALLRNIAGDRGITFGPVDPIERGPVCRHRRLLETIMGHVNDRDVIDFVHALTGRSIPDTRDVTLYAADVVIQLEASRRGTRIETRLTVPKFRGGTPIVEELKLELTDEIAVDTSRDIA